MFYMALGFGENRNKQMGLLCFFAMQIIYIDKSFNGNTIKFPE